MEFSTEPFLPVKLGVPAEYYADILEGFNYDAQSLFPRVSGEIKIDGELRYIKFGVEDGIVQSAELTEICKQDTFCGLSMHKRTKAFYKDLANAGINSTIDENGIILADYPVGFYSEYGKVASIGWDIPD